MKVLTEHVSSATTVGKQIGREIIAGNAKP